MYSSLSACWNDSILLVSSIMKFKEIVNHWQEASKDDLRLPE